MTNIQITVTDKTYNGQGQFPHASRFNALIADVKVDAVRSGSYAERNADPNDFIEYVLDKVVADNPAASAIEVSAPVDAGMKEYLTDKFSAVKFK